MNDNPILLDVKYIGIEGGPRVYMNGLCPTIQSRDYKDPIRVIVYESNKLCIENEDIYRETANS